MTFRGITCALSCIAAMAFVVTGNSLTFAQEHAADVEWASFRGGVHPGVAASGDYPTRWNLDSGEHVKWAVAVPGRGHSSPIITNDSVIVTTAYAGKESISRTVATAATVVPFLAAILLGLSLACDIASILEQRSGAVLYWARGLFVISAGLLLLLLLDLGSDLFSYQRCPIRSWIGSHIAATLGASIALALTIGRQWTRRINGTILVLMALSVLLLIPAKEHAYRNLGPQGFVVVGTGAIPVTIAATMFALSAWRMNRKPTSRLRRYLPFAIFMITSLALTVCVGRVATGARFEHSITTDVVTPFFLPDMVHRLLIGSICGFVVSAATYLLIRTSSSSSAGFDSHPWRQKVASTMLLTSLVTGGGTVLGVMALTLNLLLPHSTFLQYHLPAPDWDRLNFVPLLSSLAVLLGTALVSVLAGRHLKHRAALLGIFVTILTTLTWPLHVVVANAEHHEQHLLRAVVAFNRADGSRRWVWEGLASAREGLHRENSPATPTAVAAQNRIVAYFGSAGLVCLDASSGRPLWSRTDIGYQSVYGPAASPVVANGRVIVISDAPAAARIVAVDLETGTTAWEHDRTGLIGQISAVSGHSHTPLVMQQGDQALVVVVGWNRLMTYDMSTGEIVADYELTGDGDRVASPASDGQHVYFGNPRELTAITRASLLTASPQKVWRAKCDSNCVSPVADGDRIYTCSDRGIVHCVDHRKGKVLWRDRLHGEFRSSPIIAGRHLYLASLEGTLHILDLDSPDREWHTQQFPEPIFATPAATNSQIFVRTESSLVVLE